MADRAPQLALDQVLQTDVAEIIAAREKARILHGTKDIGAAGNEVEQAVRDILRRKLPVAYYVGHGHVVDAQGTASRQHDVIIADNFDVPVLFRTREGVEYLPYESIYAIGEVKSGYYKSQDPVGAFVQATRQLRQGLVRASTPPTWSNLGRGQGFHFDVPIDPTRPYRNPLFTFMIFVNSDGFSLGDLSSLYASSAVHDLPNAVCLLDRGVVVNQRLMPQASGELRSGPMHVHPEFLPPGEGMDAWVLVTFEQEVENASVVGHNFGLLYYLLLAHLGSCVLTVPNLLDYLQSLFPPIRSRLLQ